MNIIYLPVIDSSNRYALDNFELLEDDTLLLAEGQNAGKGRRGNSWNSPTGVNIYATWIIKKPSFPVHAAPWIGALATLDALQTAAPQIEFQLKWPNDILCGFRKIAGILVETKLAKGNTVAGLVLGIGINVNMTEKDLEMVDRPATSLLVETGKKSNLMEFSAILAENLIEMKTLAENSESKLFKLWKEENCFLGQAVQIHDEKQIIAKGKFSDLKEDGALVLTDDYGNTKSYHSGEVSLRV